MTKDKMVKKLLATAFAVAGLTLVGDTARAFNYNKGNTTGFASAFQTQNGISVEQTSDSISLTPTYNYDEDTFKLQSAEGGVLFSPIQNSSQLQYYKWSWNNPNADTPRNEGMYTDLRDVNASDKVYFYGLYSVNSGGAWANISNNDISTLSANFINNSAANYGGAIYQENGTIGALTGNFIGNSA